MGRKNHGLTMLNAHDKFFKASFSRLEVARDFITAQLPDALRQTLDLSAMALSDSSFVDGSLDEYFADLVYECPSRSPDGVETSLRVALLFEHKSYTVRYPHFQLLRYLLNGWEADQKEGLPPRLFVPIIIFHGEDNWKVEPMKSYFPGIQAAQEEFIPDFNYLFYDLSALPDEVITNFSNRFLALSALLLKYSREKEYVRTIGAQLAELLRAVEAEDPNFLRSVVVYLYKTQPRAGSSQLANFLRNVSTQTNPNIMTVYDSILEEGELKGELKSKLEIIREMLLADKFTAAEIMRYTKATAEMVQQVRDSLSQ